MPQCFICHKSNMRNLQVSHSKHRTKKMRKPNLHSCKMVINGKNKRVKLCTKCLRREKKTHFVTPSASFIRGKEKQEEKEKKNNSNSK